MRSVALSAVASAGRQHPITVPPPPPTGVRAFPTAEGFGAESLGGRGSGLNDANRMTVYKVTNLTDPATRTPTFDGSLRWAVEATGPRVVVFGVAGYIVLNKSMKITNDFIYIAAQTAPGDGICLKSAQKSGMACPFEIDASHVTIRHLRSRPYIDTALGTPGAAHSGIELFNIAGKDMHDVIIDHCSCTWGYDVNLQFGSGKFHDVTIQWCIAAEGYQPGHQRALSSYAGALNDRDVMGPFTLHHNLMARGDYRDPAVALKWGRAEMYNNVAYGFTDWGGSINPMAHGIPPTPGKVRWVGNWWKSTANPSVPHGSGGSGPANSISGMSDVGHDERYLEYLFDNIGPGRTSSAQPHSDSMATLERPFHYTSDPECTGPAGLTDSGTGTDPALANYHTTYVGFPDGKFHHPPIPVTATTPQQAWRDVLHDTGSLTVPGGALSPGALGAGACVPMRDSCDQRIFNYCIAGTNASPLNNNLPPEGYPVLATTPANPADTGVQPWAPAGDGIPAAWVSANIPAGKFPYSLDVNGYTYMENYLNELAGDQIP